MKYTAEVTFKIGSNNESTYEESFDNLQSAVGFIEHQATGHMTVTAYINNRRVKVRSGKVIGKDGEAFCTGQAWHDLFADYDYPQITPLDELLQCEYLTKGEKDILAEVNAKIIAAFGDELYE